jgi:hypothetical protein
VCNITYILYVRFHTGRGSGGVTKWS